MTIFRSAVRPLVTLLLIIVLCLMVYQDREIPAQYWALVVGVIGWWFYDRSKNLPPTTPKVP